MYCDIKVVNGKLTVLKNHASSHKIVFYSLSDVPCVSSKDLAMGLLKKMSKQKYLQNGFMEVYFMKCTTVQL